jgi:predicted nucleic-acid-binding Zn-ribbon protein
MCLRWTIFWISYYKYVDKYTWCSYFTLHPSLVNVHTAPHLTSAISLPRSGYRNIQMFELVVLRTATSNAVTVHIRVNHFLHPQWKNIHSTEGHDTIEMGGSGGQERCLHGFGGETKRRQLWRPVSKWRDSIKMDLEEVGWGLIWLRLWTCGDRCRFHKMRRISWLRTVSFSGRTLLNGIRGYERTEQRNTNGLFQSIRIMALRIRTTATISCHTCQFSQSYSEESSTSYIFRNKYKPALIPTTSRTWKLYQRHE